MNLRNIRILSIAVALIGLTVLYGISLSAKTPLVALSDVPQYQGTYVTAHGMVETVYTTGKRTSLTLYDKGTRMEVVTWNPVESTAVGDWISVTGRVGTYRGVPQIVVDEMLSIEHIPHATPHITIADVSGHHGEYVSVEGRIVSLVMTGRNTVIHIKDDRRSIPVFVKGLPSDQDQAITRGDRVRIAGKVVQYRRNYEIKPLSWECITVLEKGEGGFTMDELALYPELYKGKEITIVGHPQHRNGRDYLTSNGLSLLLIDHQLPETQGTVTLHGRFDYDPALFAYGLWATDQKA